MKNPLIYFLSIVFLLLSNTALLGQRYSLAISNETFTLEGSSYKGYSTEFIQPFKEVKKEWWRYINSRTVIFNKKTHLELTVTANRKEANSSLKFVSQTYQSKQKDKTIIRLALMPEDIPANQLAELSAQAKLLLKDFKINYFTKLIQEKIEIQESESRKVSIQMDKLLFDNSQLQQWIDKRPEEKEKFVKKLKTNTKAIEALQQKLNASQSKITGLKKELTLIK